MKRLLQLAACTALALVGMASPVRAHGSFGLFYERCTGCCAGCPRPWNAFSTICCPAPGAGQWYGDHGQMPCMPYQGPGDPRQGRYLGLNRIFGRYGCGDPNVGCGMGCSIFCRAKEWTHGVLKGLGQSKCCHRDGLIGGEEWGDGVRGKFFSGLCGGHGCGRLRLFGFSLFHKGEVASGCSGCSAPVGHVAAPVSAPAIQPASYQAGYPVYYYAPMPYPTHGAYWGNAYYPGATGR